MTNRGRVRLCLFLAIGALSLGAGLLVEPAATPLDQLCSARSAQELETQDGRHWLLHQHALDLRGDGQGDYKASSRLLAGDSGQTQGYLHRTTSFSHRREGPRLLLHVQQSGKSETDNLQDSQLAGLGMFIFTEDADLTFRVRRIDSNRLLISNGLGIALLCEQNLPRN